MGREQRLRAVRLAKVGGFKLCPNPAKPEQVVNCSAADLLGELLAEGRQLPRFRDAYGHREGDCREVALALMVDLILAGRASGWVMVDGKREAVDHCWLEYDGWAVDASTQTSASTDSGIFFMDAELYRKDRQAIRTQTAEQVQKWILKERSGD